MLTQPDRFDVALLHLDRPVFYQDNIIPICLPPPDISLTGKVGLVAGWGKTDNTFGKTGTNILHKVLVDFEKRLPDVLNSGKMYILCNENLCITNYTHFC